MFGNYNIPTDKKEMYQDLISNSIAMLEVCSDKISNLSNLSSIINYYLEDINWVGFYLIKGEELILGPFQGLPACTNIPLGKGVCGTSAKTLETQNIKNVHDFEGHIACDSNSNSEIVIPLVKNKKIYGVLDIDSPIINRFDKTDQQYLELLIDKIIQYI